MKYKTFSSLRTGVVALVVAGAAFVGCRAVTAPQQTPSAVGSTEQGNYPTPLTVDAPPSQAVVTKKPTQPTKPNGSTKPSASQQQATAGSEPLTDWQQEVLKMQKQPLSNGDVTGGTHKWVVNGGGMRAEFRCDDDKGSTIWNRVKVDLNANKKYEERWDFKPDGSIKRRVSPNDDENYTDEWTLKGQMWVRRK